MSPDPKPPSSRTAPATSPARRNFPPPPQTRETLREWDRRAMEEFKIPGLVLMENAGAGAARAIEEIVSEEGASYPEPFQILCGQGNNGGDGLVVARHLHQKGFPVVVWLVGVTHYPPGSDAAVELGIVKRMRIRLEEAPKEPTRGRDLEEALSRGTVIDALFGTGLSRPVRSPFLEWIEAVNSSGLKVLAVDTPSGLDSTSGEVLGAAIRADHTITFAASKVGFERRSGPRLCGTIHVIDIGIPREIWEPAARC